MLKVAVVAARSARLMVTASPVLSPTKLRSAPKPTLKSIVSPALTVRSSENGCVWPKPLMSPLKSAVAELWRMATSTVLPTREMPSKRPATRYVPASGAIQRSTFFSPLGPGCMASSSPGWTTTFQLIVWPVVLNAKRGYVSGNTVPCWHDGRP